LQQLPEDGVDDMLLWGSSFALQKIVSQGSSCRSMLVHRQSEKITSMAMAYSALVTTANAQNQPLKEIHPILRDLKKLYDARK
jgi:hypothetical protein